MGKKIFFFCIQCILLAVFVNGQAKYTEITLPELMKKKISGDENMVIVDVRTRGEYGDTSQNKSINIGRINGAINITLQDLEKNPESIKKLEAYKEKEIYLICSHSYRSRTASKILLEKGFNHVNNVQGGMTEWYRRYDDLAFYRSELKVNDIPYNNLSPSQLMADLLAQKKILLLGIRNTPRMWWDSANVKYMQHFPMLKNTVYYNFADSLNVLAEARKDPNRMVVLFNINNNGAAELAAWLKMKGISNVNYLIGNLTLFYETVANLNMPGTTKQLFEIQSPVKFLTPLTFCSSKSDSKAQWVDLRHDSIFNKVNNGVKHDYTHMKNAVNFFADKSADEFEKTFSDKKVEYIFIISFGSKGIVLADELARKGYKIFWLAGGYDRWEWYMNNTEGFSCNQLLDIKN